MNRKIISSLLILSLLCSQTGFAQEVNSNIHSSLKQEAIQTDETIPTDPILSPANEQAPKAETTTVTTEMPESVQETTPEYAEENAYVQTDIPLQEIGLEEAPASRPKQDSDLKNWIFTAGSVIVGTLAIVLVGWSQGSSPHHSSTRNSF